MLNSKLLMAVSLGLVLGASTARAQDTVLVQSGAVNVTASDLLAEIERVAPKSRDQVLANPATVDVVLKTLMTRRLLAQEARANGLAQTPSIKAQLALTEEKVLSEARMQQYDSTNMPDEAAVDAYARSVYSADEKPFQVPVETRARHILIKGDGEVSRAEAEKLRAEIDAGASFEKLAQEKSQDPGSAAKGGDLGFFPAGRMVPAFDEALKSLDRPGQVSEPVKTQFGWHLIQLVERRPATVRPYEEVADGLRTDARNRLLAKARQEKSASLLQSADFKRQAIESFLAEKR